MFKNYPLYARQVLTAAKSMSKDRKSSSAKMGIASLAAVATGAAAFIAGGNALEMMQVSKALESVSGDIQSVPVEVKVNSSGETLAELLGDDNGLSASEQVQIAEQIKASINTNDLANATGRMIDEKTAEITVVTSDSIPVVVTVVKDEQSGSYKIASVVAQLNKESAAAQKETASTSTSSPSQKQAHAAGGFASFSTEAFDAAIGLAKEATDEEALGEYARQMSVLADDVVMAIPDGLEPQEVEQPVAEAAAAEVKDPKGEASKTRFNPYNRGWKASDGTSLSVRAENLGEAFSQMNGLDAVNKMMGYWKETAESVANGAGQQMKNPEAGFVTETFYDEESGMWGYWGTVSFTDGSRDIVYDRVVFIDEVANQMITVSYRHDGAVDAGGALSLDEFKKLFFHGAAPATSGHAAAALSTCNDKLAEIGLGQKPNETVPQVEVKDDVKTVPAAEQTQEQKSDEEQKKADESAASSTGEAQPQQQEQQQQASSPAAAVPEVQVVPAP